MKSSTLYKEKTEDNEKRKYPKLKICWLSPYRSSKTDTGRM